MKKCKHKFLSDGGPCIHCKLTRIELDSRMHLIDMGDQIEEYARINSEEELNKFMENKMNDKKDDLKMGDTVEVDTTHGLTTPLWECRIFIKYGRNESVICVSKEDEESYHNGETFAIIKWQKDTWRIAKIGIIKFWKWLDSKDYGDSKFIKDDNDNAYYVYKDMPKQMLIGYMLEYIMETKEVVPGISRIQSIEEYYKTLVDAL